MGLKARIRWRPALWRFRWWRERTAPMFPKHSLTVDAGSSFVVLAPHCDDETLAAGGLLTMAAAQGIPATIVMVTNGDGFNGYALGSQHRRLRPTPAQYIAFAYRRQEETLTAVQQMGLKEDQVVFLGYPDRGLAAMWGNHWTPDNPYRSRSTRLDHSPYRNSLTPGAPFAGRALVDDLKRIFRRVRPTHIITSHPHDAHSDHWATYCFALYALAELLEEGEDFAGSVEVLAYLTHRGRWPRPSGFRPGLPLDPPRHYEALPFPWVTMELPSDVVNVKHRALLAYESQLRFMRQYLLSFVRRNELFGLFAPLPVPRQGWGVGNEPALPEGPGEAPLHQLLDPVPPTWAGRVRRAGDIQSVQARRDDDHLFLRLHLRSRPARQLSYVVTLYGVGQGATGRPVRNRLDVAVKMSHGVVVRGEGEWQGDHRGVAVRVMDRTVEVAVPLALLRHPARLFVGAQSRYGPIVFDQVAWHMVVLGTSTGGQDPDVALTPDGAMVR